MSIAADPLPTIELDRPRTRSRWRRWPWLPALFLAPLVVFGIFDTALAPHAADGIDLANTLRPPAWQDGGDWSYPFGTDPFGRDIFSRLIVSSRVSLIVAVVGVGLAGIIGVTIGAVAGHGGGKLDELLMRIVDMQLAVPPILLAILLAAALGGGLKTIVVTIAIAFWPAYARIVRGETLGLTQREFVSLAIVAGCSRWRVLRRHIFPNLIGSIVVLATLQLGGAVGLEAALSFLGIGIQPPDSTWGLMIADGRSLLDTAWWVPTFPGIMIMITVLGANLLGDWLRDATDPTLRQM